MNRIYSAIPFGFAILVVGLSANSTASADTQRHLNQLAAGIERQANALIGESRHYRHSPSYRTIINESIKMRKAARHVRVTTFCVRSFRQLEQDLRILDACFHNLEAIFDGAEFNAARGIGHVHGNTRHVKRMLNRMEDDIVHMRYLARVLRRELFGGRRGYGSAVDVYRSPYRGYGRGYPTFNNPPRCDYGRGGHRSYGGINYGGGGVTLNRGGFSVRIGF